MMDYVKMEKSALGRLVDVHVPSGGGGGMPDYFLVIAKVKGEEVSFKIRKELVKCREVIKIYELSKRAKK